MYADLVMLTSPVVTAERDSSSVAGAGQRELASTNHVWSNSEPQMDGT